MFYSTDLSDVVVAQTKLCFIDKDKGILKYRGYHVEDLAKMCHFEEVVYLLFYGKKPDNDQLMKLKEKMAFYRSIPYSIKKIIDNIPREVSILEVLRTAVSALGSKDLKFLAPFEQVLYICTKIPTVIAYRFNLINDREMIEPRSDLSHVENYLYMLFHEVPDKNHVRALESYLILTLEHGLNPSTFAARIVSSTHSDMVSSVCAAFGALKGPLHGGALGEIINMIKKIEKEKDVYNWLEEKIKNKEKLAGFGHRIYKSRDPRVIPLKNLSYELSNENSFLNLAMMIEEQASLIFKIYKPDKNIPINMEYFAAILLHFIGFSNELFIPTFSVSRSIGWCLHSIEAFKGPLIYPQSEFRQELT
ncbi:citrate/2-methylcitrate synthase [Bacillus chungangensis]|uniref:Citrate synthase n=1 Tax=Bacillus chungangensis TaxID=587633 RepID=A0ABT9WNJ8_9BACI|nr:citrate/2-methylcitrate synthase [Bacillus chungangensis]MDQ0174862.1 citrate synthase [Bacillus chungangensis]